MKQKLMIALLCLSMLLGLAACSTTGGNTPPAPSDEGTSDASSVGGAVGASISCPVNMTPKKENVYPYMGLTLRLPDELWNAVLDNTVFMWPGEDVEYTNLAEMEQTPPDWQPTAENTVLHSGYIEFLFLPEGVREKAPHIGMEKPMSYEEYLAWIERAHPMARLEMFRKAEFQEAMLESDGLANHERLGENEVYVYYLSTNEASSHVVWEERELLSALGALSGSVEIFEARPMDDGYFGITTPEVVIASQAGAFQAQTLDGKPVDQGIFADARLTMVNVWTTWCGSCVDELPDLENLSEQLKDLDVQLLGIAYDTYDPRAKVNVELLELAMEITKRTGVTFPTLIPDSHLMDGLLQGMLGYPTTFFVDSQGNLVGDPVLGSNSAEDWMQLIRERLAEVNG